MVPALVLYLWDALLQPLDCTHLALFLSELLNHHLSPEASRVCQNQGVGAIVLVITGPDVSSSIDKISKSSCQDSGKAPVKTNQDSIL
jgi:hypothetical protein